MPLSALPLLLCTLNPRWEKDSRTDPRRYQRVSGSAVVLPVGMSVVSFPESGDTPCPPYLCLLTILNFTVTAC